MLAIETKNLCKDFEAGDRMVRVIDSISIQIRLGELTMLVGPSGCGKTTLISLMTSILSVTEGSINVLGQTLTSMRDRDKVKFRRNNIGFIFQQYNLLSALTAAENAAVPLIAAGVDFDQAVAQAHTILARIGMADHETKLPRQLSGGQQQRVAIARALVHHPKLVVCDEPTAALDAKTGQSVMQILRTMANEENRAVVVVTHDNRIYHYADRILEMSDGRIIGDHKAGEYVHKE